MQTVSHATASRSTAYESLPFIRDTLARTRSYSATARMTGYPEATLRQLMAPPPPRPGFIVPTLPAVKPTPLSPRELIMLCCAEDGLSYGDIIGECRKRRLAWPRQRFMWVMRKAKPRLSLPEIGRRFGGRDHTTVIHAIRSVEERYLLDDSERDRLDALVEALADLEAPIVAAGELETEIARLEAELVGLRARHQAMLPALRRVA